MHDDQFRHSAQSTDQASRAIRQHKNAASSIVGYERTRNQPSAFETSSIAFFVLAIQSEFLVEFTNTKTLDRSAYRIPLPFNGSDAARPKACHILQALRGQWRHCV